MTPNRITHQHYFEERSVFAGGGVMGGSEGSRERADWMSEVESNIRPWLGKGWV